MNKRTRTGKPCSNVVRAIFSTSITLNEYIPVHLICPDDSQKYLNFCNTTLIIPPAHDNERTHIAALLKELSTTSNGKSVDASRRCQVSFKDILHGFIAAIIRKYPNGFQVKHEQNILALGYRSKRHNSNLGMRNNADIECFAVNTVHLLFASDNWKIAASRLGESIMRHLLGCAMFVLTENDSYIQVSGVASSEMVSSSYFAQPSPYGIGPATCTTTNSTTAATAAASETGTVVGGGNGGDRSVGSTGAALPGTVTKKQGRSLALSLLLKELSARLIPRYMMFYGDDRHSCNISAKRAARSSDRDPSFPPSGAGASAGSGLQSIRSYYYLKPNHNITEERYPLLFSPRAQSSNSGERRTYYDYVFIHPLLSQGKSALAVDLFRQIFLTSSSQFPPSLAAELAISHSVAGSVGDAGTVNQASLFSLCRNIVEGYKNCNISLLLSLCCKQTVTGASTGGSKKPGGCGRGKRGGKHVRQRVLFRRYLTTQASQSHSVPDTQLPLPWGDDDGGRVGGDDVDGGENDDAAALTTDISENEGVTNNPNDGCANKSSVEFALPRSYKPSLDFYSLLDVVTASETSGFGTVAPPLGSVLLDGSTVATPAATNRAFIGIRTGTGLGKRKFAGQMTPAAPPVPHLTTIGERLYKRVSRCCRRDQRCCAAGYITQDEEEDEDSANVNPAAVGGAVADPIISTAGCLDPNIAAYFASAHYRRLLGPLSLHVPVPDPSLGDPLDVSPERNGAGFTPEAATETAHFLNSAVLERARSLPYVANAFEVTRKASSVGGIVVAPVTGASCVEPGKGFHFKMDSVHIAAAAATPASSGDYQSSGTSGTVSCGRGSTAGISSSSHVPGPGQRSQGSQSTPLHGMFSDSWLGRNMFVGGSQDTGRSMGSQESVVYGSQDATCGVRGQGIDTNRGASANAHAATIHGMACPVSSVCQFVTAVCRSVFPVAVVWGSARNQNRFLRFVSEYIRLGRYENRSVRQLLECLRMNDIPWLVHVQGSSSGQGNNRGTFGSKKRKMATGDAVNAGTASTCGAASVGAVELHQVNSVLLAVFLQWVFTSVVNPLLSTTFYITEGEGLGASVLFYLRSVWTSIIAEVGVKQIRQHFMEISLPTAADVAQSKADAASNGQPGASWKSSAYRPAGAPTARAIGSKAVSGASFVTPNALCDVNADSLPYIRFVPKKNTIRPIVNMKYNSGVRPKQATGASAGAGGSIAARKLGSMGKNHGAGGGALTARPPSHFVGGVNTWGTVGGGTVMTNGALYQALHLLKHLVDNSGRNYFRSGGHARPGGLSTSSGSAAAGAVGAASCTAAAGFSTIKGFGCLGMDEAYVRFKQYKQHVLRNFMETKSTHGVGVSEGVEAADGGVDDSRSTVNYPKFYVAALDLEKCYDNIDTTRLYDIVVDMTAGDSGGGVSSECDATSLLLLKYTVSQYIESMERSITKRLRFVVDEGDIAPFPSVAKALAHKYHNSILTDGVIYPSLSVAELRRLIKHHLFNHVVQLPKFPVDIGSAASAAMSGEGVDVSAGLGRGGVFTQVKGIPQGSILSPLLCKVYYDFVETKVFGQPAELELLGLVPSSDQDTHGKTCIIRMVDDYLIVSTDQSCVQHFLQKVHTAYTPFGGGVNPLKTRVNFDSVIEVNGEKLKLQSICDDGASAGFPFVSSARGGQPGAPGAHDHWLSWCGYFINTRTLEVAPNFTRILDLPIQHNVTVEYTKSVGLALRKAMKTYVKAKCHGILLDSTINSLSIVENNVYEIFRVAALRTACYIKKLLTGPSGSSSALNSRYVVHCVLEAILYGARLLHTRTVRTLGTSGATSINRAEDQATVSPLDVLISDAENAASLPRPPGRISRGLRATNSVRNTGGNDLNSRGICLISVNDAIKLGMQAFVQIFSQVQAKTNGMFSHVIKILSARMENRNQTLGDVSS